MDKALAFFKKLYALLFSEKDNKPTYLKYVS